MAIQAQYPSNVLHLNRNIQEGKSPLGIDYSMRPNHGGGGGGVGGGGDGLYIDNMINMSFNNGGVGVGGTNNSTRKRAREAAAADNMPTNNNSQFISLQQQQQQPQYIDLGQLYTGGGGGQKNVVSTGLGLASFNNQQQKSASPQSSTHSSVLLSLLSDDLASHMKQQRDEVDQFLFAQGEQLRRTLVEKRQRHYRTLLNAAEELAAKRLREKEAEVGKAIRRNAELESKANQLSMEAQTWQARARMQENYAAALQLQLQQAIIAGGGGGGGVEDVDENSTGVVGGEAEDAESAYIDPDRVAISSLPSCKSCRKRVASVVLLPCRHLCLCSECDAVAQACPACLTVRSSSIEVFFS